VLGQTIEEMIDAELPGLLVDPTRNLGGWTTLQAERKSELLAHSHGWKHRAILRHVANPARTRRLGGHVPPFDEYPARARPPQAANIPRRAAGNVTSQTACPREQPSDMATSSGRVERWSNTCRMVRTAKAAPMTNCARTTPATV